MTTTETTSWITKTGVIQLGQRYRDARPTNVRTLRVDKIVPRAGDDGADVHYAVIRQDHGDGRITEPMRTHHTSADRLTSRAFVLITAVQA